MPIIADARFLDGPRLLRALSVAAAFALDLWVWGGDTQTWGGGHLPAAVIVAVALPCYACLAVWRSPCPAT